MRCVREGRGSHGLFSSQFPPHTPFCSLPLFLLFFVHHHDTNGKRILPFVRPYFYSLIIIAGKR